MSRVPADLIEATAEFKRRIQKLPEFRGWSIRSRPAANRVAVEARDPVFGLVTHISMSRQEYDKQGAQFLRAVAKSPQVKVMNAAPKNPTNAQLLDSVRTTASAYSWSFDMYRQVIQLLAESRAIREDGFQWLLESGPSSHPYWVGYRHSRPAWRGLPTGSPEEQYKAYRRKYLRDRRRYQRGLARDRTASS